MNRHGRRKRAKMEKQEGVQIGRLAFRRDGALWNCYWAKNETMEDALLIGSIRMSVVEQSEGVYDRFVKLMGEAFADVVEQTYGVRPEMPGPIPAPDSERTGNA